MEKFKLLSTDTSPYSVDKKTLAEIGYDKKGPHLEVPMKIGPLRDMNLKLHGGSKYSDLLQACVGSTECFLFQPADLLRVPELPSVDASRVIFVTRPMQGKVAVLSQGHIAFLPVADITFDSRTVICVGALC